MRKLTLQGLREVVHESSWERWHPCRRVPRPTPSPARRPALPSVPMHGQIATFVQSSQCQSHNPLLKLPAPTREITQETVQFLQPLKHGSALGTQVPVGIDFLDFPQQSFALSINSQLESSHS